ncbi:CYTH and CHAD domain-containing protein [Corynebacterium sp. 35RC1]|nr:CYTH and CHAD domain-containing protein [Corynebacterium sp. 35RC1]
MATNAQSQHVELELKFAPNPADPHADLPDFTQLEGVAQVGKPVVHQLSALYFDTEDLRLTRNKITLRRRLGGKDSGWHVKLPQSMGRLELHTPLQDELDSDAVLSTAQSSKYEVPDVVRAHVRAIVRGLELVPIARVDNERHEILLENTQGQAIAEISDDHVTATSYLPGGSTTEWRELEAEATEAAMELGVAEEILNQAREALLNAGAVPSQSPSKLVSALGASERNAPHPPGLAELEDPAAQSVLESLARNVETIVQMDPKVRRDEWDSIHQMRVATRELRSHLSAFADMFAPGATTRLDEALKQLAAILGKARDAEVIREKVSGWLEQSPTPAIDDAASAALRAQLQRDYLRAHERVVRILNDERYLTLLSWLEAFLSDPPLAEAEGVDVAVDGDGGEDADGKADVAELATFALLPKLERSYKKAAKKFAEIADFTHIMDAAEKGSWGGNVSDFEEGFHTLRKSIKKLRYVTEAVGEAARSEGYAKKLPIGDLYSVCKRAQTSLGEFQDSVTIRDTLARKAKIAARHGEDTFAYGVCYQHYRELGMQQMREAFADFQLIEAQYDQLIQAAKKQQKKQAKAEAKAAKAAKEAKKRKKKS